MKVKVESAGKCRKVLHVETPAEMVESAFNKAVSEWQRAAQVPGFRRGRAPQAVVERRYASEIAEEVRQNVVRQTLSQAIRQAEMTLVAILDMDYGELNRQAALTYSVTMDVAPEFKLPKYKGISLKENPIEVKDEQVDKVLQSLIEEAARYEDVSGRPVRRDDLVQVDYNGKLDGQPLPNLGKAAAGLESGRDSWVMANDDAFLPGFGEGLLDHNIGDEIDVQSTFPADFRFQALAGKTVVYRVTIRAIREKKLPALDAEFLRWHDAQSEEELRGRLRDSLEETMQRREKARLKEEIASHLLAKTDMEPPDSLVQEETQARFSNLVRSNLMRGVPQTEIDGKRSELLASAISSAAEKVKLDYILLKIANEEDLQLEEAEFNEALEEMAVRYRVPSETLRQRMEENEQLESFRQVVRNEKTLNFLLENAQMSKEGFFKRLVNR